MYLLFLCPRASKAVFVVFQAVVTGYVSSVVFKKKEKNKENNHVHVLTLPGLTCGYSFLRLNIKGSAEGAVTAGPVNVSLKAQLKNLATQCSELSDVAITYYATELPTECATNLDDLVELIEQFPSRLAKSTNPQGIPLKVTSLNQHMRLWLVYLQL